MATKKDKLVAQIQRYREENISPQEELTDEMACEPIEADNKKFVFGITFSLLKPTVKPTFYRLSFK